MLTCRAGSIAALAALLSMVASIAVGADDAQPYASPTDAYRQGMATLKTGDTKKSLTALEYAADRGVLGAQLKLARIYAAGNGVKPDQAKALSYYRQIANQRADISPSSPIAKYVAEAFVALGRFNLEGVESASLRADPDRAANLFRHAASYFGDADAQYELARLYLAGNGVDKNVGLAVNWLATAAKKQHAEAQATLGELLWEGQEVRQRQSRGLALIMLAHANAFAEGKEPAWIQELYLRTQGEADAAVREEARSLIPELGGAAIALESDTPPAPAKSAVAATPPAPSNLPIPANGLPASTPVAGPAAATAEAVIPQAPSQGALHMPGQAGVPVGFAPASPAP